MRGIPWLAEDLLASEKNSATLGYLVSYDRVSAVKQSPNFDTDITQIGVPPSAVARFFTPRERKYNGPHNRNY
jgi:hypothetical protein